jgi:hypothetical protein
LTKKKKAYIIIVTTPKLHKAFSQVKILGIPMFKLDYLTVYIITDILVNVKGKIKI